MSEELERLLAALYEKRTCPNSEKSRCSANFERLLSDALARKEGVSRDELLAAISERYAEFRRARLKQERERLSRLQ